MVRPTPQANSLRSNGYLVSATTPQNRSPRSMTAASGSVASTSHALCSQVSSSSVNSQRPSTGHANNHSSGRSSDYAQLADCVDAANHSGCSQNVKEDDTLSVAGTVFNEPWDSNVWENLLDLAQYGDEKPGGMKHVDSAMNSCIEEPIAEEDSEDEIACSLEASSDGEDEQSIHVVQEKVCTGDVEEYGTILRKRDAAYGANEMDKRRGIVETETHGKSTDASNNTIFSGSNSKINTLASRKEVSNSLVNVSDGTASLGSRKTLNSHSVRRSYFIEKFLVRIQFFLLQFMEENIPLPRVLPRYAKIDDAILESLDDISTSIRALSPIISPPRLRTSLNSDPSTKIQEYVERLSRDENTVFGATLKRFTECTVEGEESDPQVGLHTKRVVIRNVRQFLNGMKNYLVKHGEGELHDIIEKERSRLNANEFLNIDAILEAVLHKIVLSPVKPHLYHLMVREHSKNGWLQSLSENLTYVRTLSPEQLGFGIHCKFTPLSPQKMEAIKICLRKMQHHYSPLKKLENLLRVIFMAVGQHRLCNESPTLDSENFDPVTGDAAKTRNLPPADELVRWLVYLLARTSTVGCEVEAWYMWELLPKQLLTTGDTSYYLIALFSAVDVLKNTESIRRLGYVEDPYTVLFKGDSCSSSAGSTSPILSTSDAFVRVAIPDEIDGSIRYHTFPGVPQMTAGKLCRVIAHQFGITNPEDHGLYLLVDGFETCLLSNECPDLIRHQLRNARKEHLFAYKRHEAKIAWPKVAMTSTLR
ncbi:unnamed protein product [Enterobius vermicularis]|uniref:VPS9 domain-containing protein n=1 Tax=Enterobius vermicularis TaxID=51028 RepID=A0A0N4UXD2_ENTVE|nr:unnamed protein product [Enterobius vermicularis]